MPTAGKANLEFFDRFVRAAGAQARDKTPGHIGAPSMSLDAVALAKKSLQEKRRRSAPRGRMAEQAPPVVMIEINIGGGVTAPLEIEPTARIVTPEETEGIMAGLKPRKLAADAKSSGMSTNDFAKKMSRDKASGEEAREYMKTMRRVGPRARR